MLENEGSVDAVADYDGSLLDGGYTFYFLLQVTNFLGRSSELAEVLV